MAIASFSISYPNFTLGQVIDPNEANQNNLDITNKFNDIINTYNAYVSATITTLSTMNGNIALKADTTYVDAALTSLVLGQIPAHSITDELLASGEDQILARHTALENEFDAHDVLITKHPLYGVTGGSANTYTLTPSTALAAYAAAQILHLKIHAMNTGASTINVSGLGTRVLVKPSASGLVDLEYGDLQADGVYTFINNGNTQFVLQGGSGGGSSINYEFTQPY